MQAPVRPRLKRPNNENGDGGLLWRPQHPMIARAGQGSAVPLPLNRQARPVNVRSAPLNAASALPIRGNGVGALHHSRSFQFASNGTSAATSSAASGPTSNHASYFPPRGVPTPAGSIGRGARPKVRYTRTAKTRKTNKMKTHPSVVANLHPESFAFRTHLADIAINASQPLCCRCRASGSFAAFPECQQARSR